MGLFKKVKYLNGKRELYFNGLLLFTYWKKNVDIVEQFRGLGVKIGKNTQFSIYPKDDSYPIFGSEPYLIEIGDDCWFSFGITFTTHDGSIIPCEKYLKDKDDICTLGRIKIGNKCFVGCNVIFCPGVTVGDEVIIAAGSVVTKDIPSGQVWGGNPARFIKTTEDLAKKIIERSATQESIDLLNYFKSKSFLYKDENGNAR